MSIVIPSTIAEIDSAHKSDRLVDNDTFFVVRPHGYVVGVSNDFHIGVFAELGQDVSSPFSAQVEQNINWFKQQYIDFDPFACFF